MHTKLHDENLRIATYMTQTQMGGEGKKIKVMSLCFINQASRHEDEWGVQLYFHHSWPRNQMEVTDQPNIPAALTLGKQLPVPIGWVDPRDSLDAVNNRKIV
jgi:hypothetical protein